MKAHLTNPEFESEFSGTPNYEPCGPKNGTGLSGVVLLRPYVPHGTKAMSEYFALGKTCREQRRTLRDEVSQNVVNDSEFKFKKVLLFNLLQHSVADLLITCMQHYHIAIPYKVITRQLINILTRRSVIFHKMQGHLKLKQK